MSEIKTGDLVQVVRPMQCCGSLSHVGLIYTVTNIEVSTGWCNECGALNEYAPRARLGDVGLSILTRLKKIDPPAIGDSLPTRANLDQPVTA